MHIANPIYDSAFKYMMEDLEVAKLFISAIIDEEVTELEVAQNEVVEIDIKEKRIDKPELSSSDVFKVCRLDFVATIKLDTGFKTVMIELQKSQIISNPMRFRRYLGNQYSSEKNSYIVKKPLPNNDDYIERKPRQIYCIFLLNYSAGLPPCPVLKVFNTLQDVYTKKEYAADNEFVNSLHHNSWIVQIKLLHAFRRSDLEKLLAIFDQNYISDRDIFLDVSDDDIPEKYAKLLRRLRMAAENAKVRKQMELEDDVTKELIERLKRLVKAEAIIVEQAQTIDDQAQELADKAQELADKAQELAERDLLLIKQQQQNEALQAELDRLKKLNNNK